MELLTTKYNANDFQKVPPLRLIMLHSINFWRVHTFYLASLSCTFPSLKLAVHWLRVGAIVVEFNMGGYQYALTADALRTR